MKNAKLTNFIPLKFSHFSVIGLLFVLNIPSAIPADAPGNIAQEPLQTSSTAKPNLMFIIDSSISMGSSSPLIDGKTRMQTAIDAAKDIIDGLGEVRVGLAKYRVTSGHPGAEILNNVADLTSSYKTTLKSSIDGISANTGGTPIAHSLRDIGRYFANGNPAAGVSAICGGGASTNLTIHPDTAAQADVACTSFLDTYFSMPSTGPVNAWCQKSFAILLTDGLARGDRNSGDMSSYLKDYDNDCTASNTAPTGATYSCTGTADMKSGTSPLTGTYAYDSSNSGTSDYVDDVAQALFEIDLQPALDDVNGDEVKNNLHTYVIALADSAVQADPLLRETAKQGGGDFLFADSSANLVSAFNQVTASIIAQTSNSSAVTFNSSTLSSQSAVYQALFNTSSWSGDLNSFPINGLTGEVISNCATLTPVPDNCWNAAEELDNQNADDRFIIVASDNSSKHGVEFKYVHGTNDYTNLDSSSDIPQALVADLCSSAAGTTVSGTSFPCFTSDSGTIKTKNSEYLHELVNYLRGDNSQESTGHKFRPRIHDLGDIVNSSPVYVGIPQQNYPSTGDFPILSSGMSSTDYQTWATAVKNRPEIIYVASNDGMLHGFRANDAVASAGEDVNTSAGQEVFAFIPSGAFSTANNEGLHFIADNSYSHRFYNDLSPTISDVYMDYKNSIGAPTGAYNVATKAKDTVTAAWRTVLLGGQGGGGKSLYLLDVTDPIEYTETTKQNPKKLVLWEFSDSNADLGFTYSKPTIAMMNNGKFAAIFGNGYNSAGCKAKLFVVFLEGGLDGTWTAGTDYFEYDTGTAHGGGAGDCNGMSTPAVVDLDGNGTADRVYAGDLKGNLWAFDLCAELTNGGGDCTSIASDWGIAHADPLMNANNGAVHDGSQPITTKPVVSLDPNDPGTDNLIIVFGTGQYLVDGDKSTTGLQRMYGVRDYDALNNSSAGVNNEWNLDGGDNSPQRWAETVFTIDSGGTGTRVFDSTDSAPANYYGWRIDLPDSGERVVVNPKIRNDIVFFNTLIPDDTTCNYGGSGWIMSVDLSNGGTPPAVVFDTNGDGIIDSNDITDDGIPAGQYMGEIPAESTFLGDNQYTPGSNSTINVRKVNVGKNQREGRMSWKELYEDSTL